MTRMLLRNATAGQQKEKLLRNEAEEPHEAKLLLSAGKLDVESMAVGHLILSG